MKRMNKEAEALSSPIRFTGMNGWRKSQEN